jgi:spore coat protein CotH
MPGGASDRSIVAQFDRDKNGRLTTAERQEARAWLESQPARGRMGGRGNAVTGTPGPSLSPKDVRTYGNEPLYDPSVLRTLFFQFENADWEKELGIFAFTDVDVPATLTVDGKVYRDVGVSFRGMSSLGGVPEGLKRSLNVAMDLAVDNQTLGGYKTLNLLNSHVDPTYLRTVLYMQAAREYLPAPKANYVRVVINGESWGIYVSAQQFNNQFVRDWYKTTDGARWKVSGSPGGRAGLEYTGDDVAPYKRLFEIRSKDNPKSWADLIRLCKVLNTTPPEQLEKALAGLLDVDGVLKFLALDVALVNGDGYWTRASDYSIYQDVKGVFHILPHDANETFGPGGGRGMGPMVMLGGPGDPRGGGPPPAGMPPPPPPPPPPAGGAAPMRMGGPGNAELDPLVGLNDATKPLRSKLLAVPALRERYLGFVKQIATKWLDWNTLGPLAQKYQALIAEDVKIDTRKLDTFENFQAGVDRLKDFVTRRRTYLLNYK